MTIPTFDPSVKPSPGTSFTPKISLNEADFGDGYSQPTPNGINHIKLTLQLKWDTLLPAEAKEIYDFFMERGGNKPFYYTAVDETEPMKFTCKVWSKAVPNVRTMTATLVQDFSNST